MRKFIFLWPFLPLLLAWIYIVVPFPALTEIDLGKNNQLFTALLIVHTGLYALNSDQSLSHHWRWLYIVLQDGLIASISLIVSPANTFIIGIGLYLLLVSETIIRRREQKFVTFTVVGTVISFLIGTTERGGWEALHHAILYITPVILVAAGYIALSFRLAHANEQGQVLFRELEEAHITLARYAERIQDLTLTHERERLARELHDTLAQGLVGLTMQLDATDALLSEDNAREAQQIVQQAMIRSRAILVNARKAIDDLRNQEAQTSQAVQQEILHFTTVTGTTCHTDLTALTGITPSTYEHILRVITEALSNIARHAHAQQVWIQATRQQELLLLEVRDDGIGFDLTHQPTASDHYGLRGLQERASLLGGQLEIESVKDRGTTLRFICRPTYEVNETAGKIRYA